ncbi:MAG TPA: crossover junction endodeoxyribonuclease RuvC [Clostridiales bacterium]|nr:crossover junction endodeoxyribonuclease RuvC [Clostridiales bacterium]
MVILGIDPGIAIMGYGIIEYKHDDFNVLDYGCVRTDSSLNTAKRLEQLYNSILYLVHKYKPEDMAVEELFFNKNAKTAMVIGQARGVCILAGSNCGLKVYEYTPLQVKQGVVGYGRAEKAQVQQMVKTLLKLDSIPKPDDAADALAVAVCHAHSKRVNHLLRE